MFDLLEKINSRPEPFEFYTASDLWTDEHTSEQMLKYHLNGDIDVSSRNTDFINRSVAWIVSKFHITTGSKIADFGCGPGLYSSRLAKEKADVTGIDFSKRSIQYAKETAEKSGLKINYVNSNYLDYETDERFDLIIMIMCDFCALSPKQRNKMLCKFHSILKPGGAMLLDVYSLKAFDKYEEKANYEINQFNGFWSPDKYYGFVNNFKYDKEKVTLDKYTIVEKSRVKTIYNWLQYFTCESLEKEFKDCAFKIENFYADVAGSEFNAESPEFAVVANKN